MSAVTSIEFVKVEDHNRDEIMQNVLAMYEQEGCGICEGEGSEVFWFSHFSRSAHKVCYDAIEEIEANCYAKIRSIFKKGIDINDAHARAVKAVRKEISPHLSLKNYLETYGAAKLKALFNTVGVKAALTLPSRL